MLQRPALFLLTFLSSLSAVSNAVSLGATPGRAVVSYAIETAAETAVGAAQANSPLLAQYSPSEAAPSPPSPLGADPSASPTSPVLLSPGTKSEDVRVLQRQLQQLGYYNGPIDGAY
ncbi:MAG TPA: peptidoglycan-binding domain-containing protein, partial [Trichocoleus sp.]